jgi:hypothetical protein
MAVIFLLPTTNDNDVMNMQTCNSGASKQHILFTYILSYSLEQSFFSRHFMEPKGSLLHFQEPATPPCPEPDQSSPCLPITP